MFLRVLHLKICCYFTIHLFFAFHSTMMPIVHTHGVYWLVSSYTFFLCSLASFCAQAVPQDVLQFRFAMIAIYNFLFIIFLVYTKIFNHVSLFKRPHSKGGWTLCMQLWIQERYIYIYLYDSNLGYITLCKCANCF